MPNWCHTNYTVTGLHSDLKRFYNVLTEATSGKWNDKIKTDFKDWWLGNVYAELGMFTPEQLMNNEIPEELSCRGEFDEEPVFDEKRFVDFGTSTAWGPCTGMWKKIFNDYFPRLNFVYVAEEPGTAVYINSDKNRRFYPVEWVLCCSDYPDTADRKKVLNKFFRPDVEFDWEIYFETGELEKWIKESFLPNLKDKPETIDDFKKFIRDFNDKYERVFSFSLNKYITEEEYLNIPVGERV